MKKLYIWMLGAVLGVNGATAQESTDVISEIKVTYENNQRVGGFDFYSNVKLDQNVANYQDGHMDVTMAEVNGKYRADIWYNRDSRDNYKMTIDPSKIGVFAIKFIGDRPNGSLKFEWLGDGWTCPGNWTPTGNIKTANGNTIYYWDLSKITNYGSAETQQLIRYHFTIADCTVEPYAYTIDWIGSFESFTALTADKDWKDDGENDMDEYVAPKVVNETTGVSYSDLTTAWNEADNDDVILIYEDQTISILNLSDKHITLKGAEENVVLSRVASHKAQLFKVSANGVLDIENITIYGGGVTDAGVSIEASASGAVVNLKDVVLEEMYSTSGQGVICMKSNGRVSLENVKAVNCVVPTGNGEMFCGTNNLTLRGDNEISIYLEGFRFGVENLTNKTRIPLYFKNPTDARDRVLNYNKAARFEVMNEGYTLQVNAKGHLAVCVDDENVPVYVPIIDGSDETNIEKQLNVGDIYHITGVKGCTIWYKENAPAVQESLFANVVGDVNVNDKEDGWKEVEADEFDYQIPANVASIDFKAVKNGKESELVTLKATGGSSTTGVEVVEAEAEEGVAEYYNLQGVKVDNPSEGLYIRKVGNKVSKVIVK